MLADFELYVGFNIYLKLFSGVSFFVMALSLGFTCINCLNNDRDTIETGQSKCLSVYWPTIIACVITAFIYGHQASDRILWRRFKNSSHCFTDLRTESDLNARVTVLLAAWDSTAWMRFGYSLMALLMVFWTYLSQRVGKCMESAEPNIEHRNEVEQCPIQSVELQDGTPTDIV